MNEEKIDYWDYCHFGYQTATKGNQASESTASSDKPVLKVATTGVSFPGSYIKMIMEI